MAERINRSDLHIIVPTLGTVELYSSYLSEISSWTDLYKNSMWPQKSDQIKKYFEDGHSLLLTDAKSNKLLAHAAIKWMSETNPILEIGTVVVSPEHAGQGLGVKVVQETIKLAKEMYPDCLQFAFCNSQSLGLFKKLGWVEADKTDLPSEVWEGCATCPNKPSSSSDRLCCDTLVFLPFESEI